MIKKHRLRTFVIGLAVLALFIFTAAWRYEELNIYRLVVHQITKANEDTSVTMTGDFNISAATFTGTGILTATNIADTHRLVPLPLLGFTVSIDAIPRPLSGITGVPRLEYDDNYPAIVWADDETTPVEITFRVPNDYSSAATPSFRILCTESDSTTPNKIDFDVLVLVDEDGHSGVTTSTNQTAVDLAGDTSTADEVTLTPATDFNSLAAGNWVRLRLWRNNSGVTNAPGDLEVKGVAFYYTAAQ